MPSHTAASALVKLYALDGAPWEWPTWQEITGIRHGLFSDDDSQLPRGWTRKDATDVQSYFRAYKQLPSEEKKLAFSVNTKGAASAYPGREFWNHFVSRHWNSWGVHSIVVEELREWDIHPLNIVIRENGLNSPWPASDMFIPMVLDTLAMKLFGEEAFPPGRTVLTTELRKCVQIIVQRSWNTIRVQVTSLKTRPQEIELVARAAFGDLETGKPTKAKVSRAIRAVAKWKECAELFNTFENIKKAEDMLAELQVVMEGLGAKVNKQAEQKSLYKVSTVDLNALATAEDVSDLLNLYHEYFDQDAEGEDEPPIPHALPTTRQLNNCGGDFGMEIESSKTAVALALALGFKSGRPLLFNTFRHRSGVLSWDDDKLFAVSEPIPDHLSKLHLHWHQLAGVHSIVRSLFTEDKASSATLGVLVADEVGLGKSAQAITVIAFLIQARWLQATDRKLPPLLVKRPYLGDSKTIPSLPHLIVCPGTLVAQWVNELKTFFLPKVVDILVYDSQTDEAQFWGGSGTLQLSKQKPHNRIIVASHSALFKDMNMHHTYTRQKKDVYRPWNMPKSKACLEHTIFGQSFLTVIVDEAHHMRNAGKKHTAVLRLLEQATVRLIMTATPLHTSSKDIAAMGRLSGIPHFFTEASFYEEKNDAAALRRAKKLDDDGEALLAEQLQAVKRLQSHLTGHFLRRTPESLDYKGGVLLPLPPYQEILGVLTLTERETAIIQRRAEAAKAVVESASNSNKIQTKKFYLEYRTAVGYAKEDPGELWPSFKTLHDWEPMKSTKMDVCARICVHYLARDDVPDVSFADGQPVFPKIVAISPEKIQKTRRIIIYSEFPSMAPLLQNVLRLYEIPSLALNGKLSFDKRDKQVKDLYNDTSPARVLIFSSVGSAGLNLSIADVVIFFDQPWSAQDERQIRGRAHRQPQKKVVKVIHLLASDSADLLMNGVARAKRDMFDTFVNKELGEELRTLLQGQIPDIVDDDGDNTDKTHRKAPKKRRKTAIVDNDIDLPKSNVGDLLVHQSDGEPISEGPTQTPTSSEVCSEPEMDLDRVDDSVDLEMHFPDNYESPPSSQTVVSNVNLVQYESSPERPSSDSPPHKRSRQGTIGPEQRVQMPESFPSSEGQPHTDKGLQRFLSSKTTTQHLSTELSGQLSLSRDTTPRSNVPCPRPVVSSANTKTNPFARKPASAQVDTIGGSPSVSTTSTPAPHSLARLPQAGVSRRPGPLSEVTPLPKSALKGFRAKKKIKP